MTTTEFLVGVSYHEPEACDQWNRGLIEDYESATGLFVEADSAEAAVEWGEQVGQALLRHVNDDPALDWKSLGNICWVEESPQESGWGHCLDFFQHVRVGEWPELDRMTTAAYTRWLKGSRTTTPTDSPQL
jgi:hypothetical protein